MSSVARLILAFSIALKALGAITAARIAIIAITTISSIKVKALLIILHL
jgi:hypothetical protein